MASQNTSVWAATAQVPTYAPLTADTSADVCVVGAGIAGLSTAYLLTQVGKSVVVLDDGAIGHGMTGVTTAHLVNALDDRFVELERLHGERGARLAAESHTAAIDLIEKIVGEEGIDCDFTRLPGYLFRAPEHDEDLINRELDAAHRAGLHGVTKAGRAPLTFDTVMSRMWMPPSPVCASSWAPKPSGNSSVTEPSPVEMSQSAADVLPPSARIVTLPSPERARTLLNLPASTMLPSPVSTLRAPFTPSIRIEPSPLWAVTSPPTSCARMLPSPDRISTRPAIRSTSIDPSPLRALRSMPASTR